MLRGVMIIEGSPKKMVKEFRSIVKEEMKGLIEDWHEDTLPEHFKRSAGRRYKYNPRSIKYTRYKRKKRPMAGPLEFSGKSRRQLERSIRITGSTKKASGTMQAPRYFWMRPAGHPKKGEEVTSVTKKETLTMAKTLNERVTKRLNKIKDKQVIR